MNHIRPSVNRRSFLLIIPALLIACFFSCKKDSAPVDDTPLIVGKWYYKTKTDKRITNGAVVQDNTYTDMNGATIQFNADNTVAVQTETGNTFTMQYTLSGDLLTYIHTESQEYYGSQEILRIKKLTSNELQLTYSPKDNEPTLTPPDGFYSEMMLTR